jgi:hypothetical protein
VTATDPPDQRPGQVDIDWSTAEVRDRSLKVALTDAQTKDWRERLDAVLRRLEQPGHSWGQVRVSKRYLKVADVPAGHEAELRHLLDAAVQQTNADLAGEAPAPQDKVSEIDQRMTDAFRVEAQSPPEP